MILSPRDKLLFSIATLTPEIAFQGVPIVEELLPSWLHEFQFQMLSQAAAYMRMGFRRVLLQSPTGSGKTKMAEAALLSTLQQRMRGQFLVHRKELLKQTSRSFLGSGLSHSFIAAKFDYDPAAMLFLIGVQTLVRRMGDQFPSNLRIVDEAHHAVSDTYDTILAADPDAYILGLTATPERLDGRGLDSQFDVMVPGPPVRWLIENGYLSPFDYYAPDIPDLTGVPSMGGDLAPGAAAAVVDKPKLVGNIVEHYQRLAPGEQGIVFAQNLKHSRNIADAFNANGIPAMHVEGDMDDERRDYFDDAFRAGDLRIGVNKALFGEGYDVPNIGYVGVGAATKSLVNHLQWCGRVLRMFPGKTIGIIADHAGNAVARNLGLPDEDRLWSLLGRAARREASGCNDDAMPVRQCKACFRVSRSTEQTCPGCGAEFPIQTHEIKTAAGQLKKLTAAEMKAAVAVRKAELKLCKEYADFYHHAIKHGFKNPVAWAKMKAKFKANYAKKFRR